MLNYFSRTCLRQYALLVLLPLLAGAAVYRFLRLKPPAIFGNGAGIESPLPDVILQSLPSFLWSFALTSALLLVWQPRSKFGAYWLAGLAGIVSVLFEVWQAADATRGTFDWCDALFSLAGCLLAMLAFSKMIVHENHD